MVNHKHDPWKTPSIHTFHFEALYHPSVQCPLLTRLQGDKKKVRLNVDTFQWTKKYNMYNSYGLKIDIRYTISYGL